MKRRKKIEFRDMREWTQLGAQVADLHPEKYDELIQAMRKIVEATHVLARHAAIGSMPRRLMSGIGERIRA